MDINCEREEFANTLECVQEVCPDRVWEEAPDFWVCWTPPETTTTTIAQTTTTQGPPVESAPETVDPFVVIPMLLVAMVGWLRGAFF